MSFEEEKRALEAERRNFEKERKEFQRRIEIEDRRLEQQQKLFDMKFKILEDELKKLAAEKEQVAKQKEFYSRVSDFESQSVNRYETVASSEMFFSGVGSKQSLRKRYRDLIKIYHPDNVDGDNGTIQEINREYDHLNKVFG
ncbi:MAG: molecular chaperone DnaJ [Agathobacter sp.]|uniref:molecular chaperone DnaJ n=1 Tax=Agathobacter sp. TaxID=2021311 RepID=UPI00258EA730|nr:molecular chaperone DnaJ [Agathobacter sp.]MCR5678424.1 molecular chaperone DnaJ [Agathobacter sp.]